MDTKQLTDDQRQALGESLAAYFGELDSDGGKRRADGGILRMFDYCDARNVDDLIDTAILPALAPSDAVGAPQPTRYFVYDNECGYEEFDTDAERDKAHQAAIEGYLDDGWSEEVTSVVSGIVTHQTVKTDEEHRPQPRAEHPDHDNEDCDTCAAWNEWPNHDFDTCCRYVPEPIAAPVAPAAPQGWKPMPPKLTTEMRTALVDAAREYMERTGGNSPEAMYEAAFAAAPTVAPAALPADTVLVPMTDLLAIYDTMNYLGDILNNMDAVEPEDEAVTDPGFAAIRRALGESDEMDAAPTPTIADTADEVTRLRRALYQIAHWPDGRTDYGQAKIKRFAVGILEGNPPTVAADAVAPADYEDERSCALQDLQFVHGLQSGWQFGILEDRAGYERCLASRAGYVKVLRETRNAAQPDERATPDAETHVSVPMKPTAALLRPFHDCPPDELELAWAAMLWVAGAQARAASSGGKQ